MWLRGHAEMPLLRRFRCGDGSFVNTRLVPLCGQLGPLEQGAAETADERAIQLMQNRRRRGGVICSVRRTDRGSHRGEVLLQYCCAVSV